MSGIGTAIAGVAVAGATAYGMSQQSGAAKDAANAQVTASQNANNTQMAMYNQTRSDQAPYRQAGDAALGNLQQFYGTAGGPAPDYNKILSGLPGYQFQLQQGTTAVDHNLAAQGLLQSGAAGKELQQYGQGVAQNYAGQYVNGLQSLAGLGQTSTAQTGAVGANAANQIGSSQIYAGNAQASGYANQANALNNGVSGLSGLAGQYASSYTPPYTGPTNGFAASSGAAGSFDDYLNSIYSP